LDSLTIALNAIAMVSMEKMSVNLEQLEDMKAHAEWPAQLAT
jgi:hypothetical protein